MVFSPRRCLDSAVCAMATSSTFLPKTRPPNWKSLAPLIPNFAHQPTSLPRLPVPPLGVTLDRLKASLRPLARSPEEYAASCAKIDQFSSEGAGHALQAGLEERKKHTGHWLEEWWDDLGYLAYRDSVVVNVSYYYGFKQQPSHLPQTTAARAAAITRGAMLFRQRLRTGQLPPDAIKETELCMDTYRWMFDCSRVPGSAGIDWSVSHAASPNPDRDLGHIIVVRKNRFWKLKAEVSGRVLGMGELIRQFQYIYDNSTDEYPAIGAMSASDRDTWAKDFALLSSQPLNAAHLRTIHSAAFLVSLDDSYPPPESEVDVSRALWHGTLSTAKSGHPRARALSSRYMDKPLQFIVFDNSVSGLMGEHSIMDGTPTVRVCDEVLEWIASPTSDFQLDVPLSTSLNASPLSVPSPVPLDFDLTTLPGIHESIYSAVTRAEALARSQSLSFIRTPYGKRAIKSFGVGPDGWAQLVVQIAYAQLAKSGKVPYWPVGTYEAATTRRFYKGRTETIRVVSDEAVKFVKAMLDRDVTREVKLQLFKEALKRHGQLAREAGMAVGVDRHMLGLKLVNSSSQPLPALFTDPLYARSSHWTLSTSAIFSKHFTTYGWGEVVPDGFGVAYVTGFDDFLQFTITSRTEMPNAEFTKEIERAAEDLYELFAGVKPGASAEAKGDDVTSVLKARL